MIRFGRHCRRVNCFMSAGLRMFETAPVLGLVSPIFTIFLGLHRSRACRRYRGTAGERPQQLHSGPRRTGRCRVGDSVAGYRPAVLGRPPRGTDNSSPTRLWLAGGVIAAMLTWLTGHPLLTAEFTTIFWMFCGLLAATLSSPSSGRSSRFATIVGVVLVRVCHSGSLTHATTPTSNTAASSSPTGDSTTSNGTGRAAAHSRCSPGRWSAATPAGAARPGSTRPRTVGRSEQPPALRGDVGDDAWHDVQLACRGDGATTNCWG